MDRAWKEKFDFIIEYAKSSRSSCKGCKKVISEGELRVGKLVPSPHHDGKMEMWYHMDCMITPRWQKNMEKKYHGGLDMSYFLGSDNLWPSHFLSSQDSLLGTNSSAEMDEWNTKEDDMIGSVDVNEPWDLEKTGDSFMGCLMAKSIVREYLAKIKLGKKDIIALCDHNKMYAKGTAANLISPVAEAIVLGPAEPCPECGSMLVNVNGVYGCTGEFDYGSCPFQSRSVKHVPFKTPKKLKGLPKWMLDNKFAPRATSEYPSYPTFIEKDDLVDALDEAEEEDPTAGISTLGAGSGYGTSAQAIPAPTQTSQAAPDTKVAPGKRKQSSKAAKAALPPLERAYPTIAPKDVFKNVFIHRLAGMHVAFGGKLKMPRKKLGKLLESQGGAVGAMKLTTVVFVVPSIEAVNSSAAYQKAVDRHILIMKEADFIEHIIEASVPGYEALADAPFLNTEPDVPASAKFTRDELLHTRAVHQTQYNAYLAVGPVPDPLKPEKDYFIDDEIAEKGEMITGDDEEEGKQGKRAIIIKGDAGVPVDSPAHADNFHVLVDTSAGKKIVWNATMSNVNTTTGANGFYNLQLLVNDHATNMCCVFKHWGRVGTTIENDTTVPAHNISSAKLEFAKTFFDKTGNDWYKFTKNGEFEKKPRKYTVADVGYDGPNGTEDADDTRDEAPSKLDKRLQAFISLIFDREQMRQVMQEFSLDMDKMPLGQLREAQVKEGMSVLKDIEAVVNEYEALKAQGTVDDAIKKDVAHRLGPLSSRFFSTIPHVLGKSRTTVLIKSPKDVAEKAELLETLLDLARSSSVANAVKKEQSDPTTETQPAAVDRQYAGLGRELVPASAEEVAIIKKAVKNTHGSTHSMYTLKVKDVFKTTDADAIHPNPGMGNRRLLWHGSRTTNIAGIVTQGLRIAPPEAPSTGYMFGKGAYLANSVSKSANYCNVHSQNPTGVLMLVEAPLGTPEELKSAAYKEDASELKKGTDSVHGTGRHVPEEAGEVEMTFGTGENERVAVLDTGKLVEKRKDCGLVYDEFIVFRESQVRIAYVLVCDFKLKKNGWM